MALSAGVKSQIPFAGSLTSLQASFARLTQSQRLLLGGMVLALLAGGVYLTYTTVSDAKTADAQAQADLLIAKSGATGVLAKQVATQTGAVRGWSWVAQSPAIGGVIMEEQLAGLALRSGLVGATVKASNKPELIGGITFVSVSVDAPFSWSGLSSFLTGLEGLGKGFMVDSVSVSDDVAPKLRLVVKLPLAAPVATAAATTAKPAAAKAGAVK